MDMNAFCPIRYYGRDLLLHLGQSALVLRDFVVADLRTRGSTPLCGHIGSAGWHVVVVKTLLFGGLNHVRGLRLIREESATHSCLSQFARGGNLIFMSQSSSRSFWRGGPFSVRATHHGEGLSMATV